MFVSNFQIRKDSTLPYLEVQITKDGTIPKNTIVSEGYSCEDASSVSAANILDLTDVFSVEFELKKCDRVPVEASVNGEVEIVDAVKGIVRYKWAATDTAVLGLFYGTFVVSFNDGGKYRWPANLESLAIEIVN